MALLRGRRRDEPDHQRAAVRDFWSWWSTTGAAAADRAIRDGSAARLADELGRRVAGVHPGLDWELAPGTSSEHVLVVSSGGDPELRPVARRWRMGAPPADRTWAYADSRQPVQDAADVVLSVDGTELDLGSATAEVRVQGTALEVVVHHPAFVVLDDQARRTATYLMLDAVLGEVDVETWLGGIETSGSPALDPVPLAFLPSVVKQLKDQHTGPDGGPSWVLLEGAAPDGRPVLASAQVPLRAASAPHLDTYVAVVVPYAEQNEAGLPGPGSLSALRSLEEHLSDRLGDSGRVVAHQTHGGVRVLHLYVDSTTPAAEQVRAAVGGWREGPVTVEAQADPGWEAVAHLRG